MSLIKRRDVCIPLDDEKDRHDGLTSTTDVDLFSRRSIFKPRHLLANLRLLSLALLGSAFLYYSRWLLTKRTKLDTQHGLPDYSDIVRYEQALPQHNLNLPFPEGRNGRYLKFSHQFWNVGLNNQLQDVIFMSHLAFLSNRAYVFRGYLWSLDPGTAVEDGPGRWRSARIPLNAFISGPTAGGSMGPNITTPRAVYNTYWDQVCPPERRTHLRVNEIHEKHGIGKDSEGVEILNLWAKILSESQDPCIDVNDGHVFDYDTIGTSHILSVWPSLSQSPIVQRFAWSPLVLNAVARNVPALLPRSSHDPWNPASQPMPSISSSENSMLKGLVALHLRRGDYGYHCENMANYSVTFTSWNQFSHLPDRFTPPAGGGFGKTTPENLAIYLKHCWPDAEHVIQKLNEIRYSNGRGNLETIFILTNGDKIWLDDLKLQLSQDGWSNVVTSKDLRLTAGESEVDGAVDMQIAARAEVFIGNGFSSLTSNINMIRLAHHLPDSTIRFW